MVTYFREGHMYAYSTSKKNVYIFIFMVNVRLFQNFYKVLKTFSCVNNWLLSERDTSWNGLTGPCTSMPWQPVDLDNSAVLHLPC